ncbi:hypothetical protein CY0110_18652 [Crocosphaera chwakensis CCY0110]|uniref:Uncharacterized protein n=1 Tax=Crocosphaera chwakensis CCY0110 TaxID=391612 RepID=A3IJ62_9CHRO|nr:hypothetical protein CY0110_18652 [Crocosphaera chwakensis CCY0110]
MITDGSFCGSSYYQFLLLFAY